jgi:hypothetical protein
MDKNSQEKNFVKQSWTKPELVELQDGTESIQNSFNIGSDGAGGVSTSLS